jgi:hypothetical protein
MNLDLLLHLQSNYLLIFPTAALTISACSLRKEENAVIGFRLFLDKCSYYPL